MIISFLAMKNINKSHEYRLFHHVDCTVSFECSVILYSSPARKDDEFTNLLKITEEFRVG